MSGTVTKSTPFVVTNKSHVVTNTSLTYYLQIKHPLQCQHVFANTQKRSANKLYLMTQYISSQTDKSVGDKKLREIKDKTMPSGLAVQDVQQLQQTILDDGVCRSYLRKTKLTPYQIPE